MSRTTMLSWLKTGRLVIVAAPRLGSHSENDGWQDLGLGNLGATWRRPDTRRGDLGSPGRSTTSVSSRSVPAIPERGEPDRSSRSPPQPGPASQDGPIRRARRRARSGTRGLLAWAQGRTRLGTAPTSDGGPRQGRWPAPRSADSLRTERGA